MPFPAAWILMTPPSELDPEALSLFDAVLLEAIAERASDIHLERYGEKVLFRLRVDGDLHDVDSIYITPEQYLGLVNVIKIRADLDIAERRVPQGGRFSASAGGRGVVLGRLAPSGAPRNPRPYVRNHSVDASKKLYVIKSSAY